MSPSYFALLLLLLLLPLTSAQSSHFGRCPKPAVQPDFNLQKYMGKWYEIESIPSFFPLGKCIEADYLLKNDGTIQVTHYQVIGGVRVPMDGMAEVTNPGKLKISFTLSSDPIPYWVLNTDYANVSVVYSCKDYFFFHRDFIWILSRSPSLPQETVKHAKELLMRKGIDVSDMVPTEQDCSK